LECNHFALIPEKTSTAFVTFGHPSYHVPGKMKKFPVLGLTLALVTNLPGLTINVVKAGNADTANPSFDPTLSQLEPIMVAAADYWTDVIKDDHVLNVTYGYQDLNNAILSNSQIQTIAPNGHASQGAIAFDTQNINGTLRPWYFDPTPKTDDGFSMKQILVADLPPSTTALYFEGTPPGQLEVGYSGNFFPSNNNGEIDLYTIALHEIGHILGMSTNLPSYASEIAGDNTIDFSPGYLDGNFVEAHLFSTTGDGRAFLRASDALMSPGYGNGDRNLPSATDIFAVASGGNWSDIRLKRVNFLSGNSWGFPLNWAAGQVPTEPQRVYLSHGETVEPPGSETLETGTLTILDESTLNIGTKTLEAKSDINIGLPGDSSGTLRISSGGKIDAENIDIRDGSLLETNGNMIEPAVEVDLLRLYPGGQIIGSGQILIGFPLLLGEVVAIDPPGPADLPLFLNAPNSVFLAAATSALPVYHAEQGSLVFGSAPNFRLYGTLNIGAGRKATFLENATHLHHPSSPAGVAISFNGGEDLATAATLEAPKGFIEENGTIVVKGFSQILGDATFLQDSTVDLKTGSTLFLNGENIFRGGTFSGDGTIQLGQTVTVKEDTTFDCQYVDLDGTGFQIFTIDDSRLTLNSQQIQQTSVLVNSYAGNMTLNGDRAHLEINNSPWFLLGSLALNRSTDPGIMLAGEPIWIWGHLEINGSVEATAPIIFEGTLDIPDATSSLILSNESCLYTKSTTTTGSGNLSISKEGGIVFDIDSAPTLPVINAGLMTLGQENPFPVGMVRIINQFTQVSTGVLEIDLAGETNTDLLAVSSSANLDGTLRINYRDGFQAEVGDTFTILTAGNLNGTFSKIEGPDGQRWEANYDPLINTVSVSVTATAYEVWVDENGLTENINDGFFDDPDGDGDPNIKEFALNGNPLNSVGGCHLYPAVTDTLDGQVFTITFPVREGAEFSEGPSPEATFDGIHYRVEATKNLEDFNLAVEPYSTTLDDDLPSLPSHYEYRTFRTEGFVTDPPQAFLRVAIQPAP